MIENLFRNPKLFIEYKNILVSWLFVGIIIFQMNIYCSGVIDFLQTIKESFLKNYNPQINSKYLGIKYEYFTILMLTFWKNIVRFPGAEVYKSLHAFRMRKALMQQRSLKINHFG